MQRYFVKEDRPSNGLLHLPKDTAHHFITVMRAENGSQCEIVLANHQAYLAELTDLDTAEVKIVKPLPTNAELPLEVTIACGVPKTKDKPEIIVQKGTELGADHFIFFESERSISRWMGKKQQKKIDRLQKIAQGAAEQSHRNRIPDVRYVSTLSQLLDQSDADRQVVAWEESAKQGETSKLAQLLHQTHPHEKWLAIFGPEGGLSESEVRQMTDHNVIPVGLGPRILRAETAPLYFMSAISYAIELS